MYGIPPEKVELLVCGADDTLIDFSRKSEIRSTIRNDLSVNNDDFVIVSGGKIDQRKNIDKLIEAVIAINNSKIKLIVFGEPNSDMKPKIEALSFHENIKLVGWVTPEKIYSYLLSSDLGFFPGTHSVLWEQAVGVGIPCVFKRWSSIQHVDVGGNCQFIEKASVKEIKEKILTIYNDKDLYLQMKKVSESTGIKQFSYYQIAKRAIKLP
jgi:glycosyltransferase involved in cell wall biosynthesis